MNGLSISSVCVLLGISRQKYYRSIWAERKSSEKAATVVHRVQELRCQMPRIGTRKLYHMMHNELAPMHIGRDKLFNILRANHLLVEPFRSYHVITNSHHRFHMHKNLIEDMTISRPEQVWVADITYIGNRNDHLYLSLITDAYSKKIVGHDLSKSLDVSGVLRSLKMANSNRMYPDEELIHHSDRGIQYCSNAYQKRLGRYGLKVSMTEKYDPYANAVAERVNGILKQEFLLEDLNLPFKDMKCAVRDVIKIYNDMRPHSSCQYLTPEEMHRQNSVQIKTYKKKSITQNSV